MLTQVKPRIRSEPFWSSVRFIIFYLICKSPHPFLSNLTIIPHFGFWLYLFLFPKHRALDFVLFRWYCQFICTILNVILLSTEVVSLSTLASSIPPSILPHKPLWKMLNKTGPRAGFCWAPPVSPPQFDKYHPLSSLCCQLHSYYTQRKCLFLLVSQCGVVPSDKVCCIFILYLTPRQGVDLIWPFLNKATPVFHFLTF